MNNIECIYCNDNKTTKNGLLKFGGQRFRCKSCNRSFTLGGKRGTYTQNYKTKIILEYCHKHICARDIINKYHISSATLVNWAKIHKKDCNCGLK